MATHPTPLEETFPAFGLRITCGPLSIRSLREADVPEVMAAVAEHGVYDTSGPTPFLYPWPEAGDRVAINALQFYWRKWAEFSPEHWTLLLRVDHDGEFVGCQDVMAHDFLATRTLETGSWLLQHRQGAGIGTLMRQAVCAFAFDELGAEVMASEAMVGNARSLGVSRRVGYEPNGTTRRPDVDGTGWREALNVRLTPATFNRPPHPVTVEGADAFRRSIGLPAEGTPHGA